MTATFRLVGHIETLAEHHVSYIIVGGVGGRIQGAPLTTDDLDIVPDPDLDNLHRLAAALSGPATMKKPWEATEYQSHAEVRPDEFWSEQIVQYRTRNGGIDVLMELPGVGPYDLLKKRGRSYSLPQSDIMIHVASLDDIIRSKEFADRSKDWRALDGYYEARARLADVGDDYELPPESLDVQTLPPGHDDPREFDAYR